MAQIAGCISSALYVGLMSGDVEVQLAVGASKAHAYAVGFAHTLPIEIGCIIAALLNSLAYVKLIKAFSRSHPDEK